jgi:GNAT superfamily N-acetyltransferase
VIEVREGSADDLHVVVSMLDDAVRWLARSGRSRQWGDMPWSANPDSVAHLSQILSRGTLLLHDRDRTPVAAAIYSGESPSYVPPSSGPELYIHLLVTTSRARRTGAGSHLLDEIARRARKLGCSHLRVDCWGGGDRRLVSYYERAGFHPTDIYDHDGWPGQVLEKIVACIESPPAAVPTSVR